VESAEVETGRIGESCMLNLIPNTAILFKESMCYIGAIPITKSCDLETNDRLHVYRDKTLNESASP